MVVTGLPVVGSAGFKVAPSGRPAMFNVTVSPLSGSTASTWKSSDVFAIAVRVVPHVGEAALPKTGSTPADGGTSWMKKSTATFARTTPVLGSASSIDTCVEYSVLRLAEAIVAPWVSQV